MTEPRTRLASAALVTLAVLAVLYTLHVARDVLLPITLALIFAIMLQPVLRKLVSWRVPTSIAALLLIVALLATLLGGGWFLSSSAMEWLRRLPEAEGVLTELRSSVREEVQEVDQAAKQVTELTEGITQREEDQLEKVVLAEPGWRDDMWVILRDTLFYSGLSVVLLFFLLSSSDQLVQRFIDSLPTRENRQRVMQAVGLAQQQMSRYLLTITSLNLLVGLVTAAVLWLAGFPDPGLWGALAATLRFIPYLGTTLTAAVLGLVAAISFRDPITAAATFGGYIVFAGVFSQLVDPFVQGARLGLDPIIVFLWIFFWGWLWSAPGVLLAVPLLALFQVACQYFSGLQTVSHLIGRAETATSPENPA